MLMGAVCGGEVLCWDDDMQKPVLISIVALAILELAFIAFSWNSDNIIKYLAVFNALLLVIIGFYRVTKR